MKLYLNLLLIFSVIATSLASKDGFLTIPALKGKIVIDGKKTEASWQHATILNSLLDTNGKDFAKEKTTIWMGHKKDKLYIYMKITSLALDPVNCRLNDFRKYSKGRDQKLFWLDQCVELRLEKLNGSAPVLIAFNANGAIMDSRKEAKRGWNKNWNSVTRIKCGTGHGYWFAELEIDLQSVGEGPVKPSDKWRMNIIEHDYVSHKRYTYARLKDGNHMSIDNGVIFVLGSSDLQVKVPDFDKSDMAKRNIHVATSLPDITWKTLLYCGSHLERCLQGKLNHAGQGTMSIPAPKEAGNYTAQFELIKSGKVFYRSPAYPYASINRKLKINIKSSQTLKTYLNGKTLDIRKQIEEPLALGVNSIVLTFPSSATLNGELQILDRKISLKKGWKYKIIPMKSELPAPYLKSSFNDSSWYDAVLKNGRILSEKTGLVIMRKSIMNETTNFLPRLSAGIWNLTRNGTYLLNWSEGNKINGWNVNWKLKNYKLVLEMPENFKLTGVSGKAFAVVISNNHDLQGNAKKLPCFYRIKTGKSFSKGNVTYNKYYIIPDFEVQLSGKQLPWIKQIKKNERGCWFGISYHGSKKTPAPIFFYAVAGSNENMQEIPNAINCNILPQAKASSPHKLKISIRSDGFDLKNDKLLQEWANTLKNAGISEVISTGGCLSPYLKKINLGQMSFFNLCSTKNRLTFYPGEASTDELFAKFPESRGALPGRLCYSIDPVYVNRHPETLPAIEKAMQQTFNRCPSMTALFWDYEISPFPKWRAYASFSSNSMKIFAEKYNIKEKLTYNRIKSKYAAKWVDFICSENAKMFKMVRRIANKYGKKLYIWSGYNNKRFYGIDWQKMSGCLDKAFCGYEQDLLLINQTKKAMAPTPLSGGLLKMHQNAQTDTAGMMVKIALMAEGGVHLWYECRLDGKAVHQASIAANVLSKYEDFISKAERCNQLVKFHKSLNNRVFAYKYHDNYLIFLVNDRSTGALKFNIKFDSAKIKHLFDTATGKEFNTAQPISLMIPSGEIVVLKNKKTTAK